MSVIMFFFFFWLTSFYRQCAGDFNDLTVAVCKGLHFDRQSLNLT